MLRLTETYQLLAQSGYVTFLAQYGGKVCLRLYGRVSGRSVDANQSTVDLRLVRYLVADYSNVKYSCYAKQASVSGEVSYSYANSDYTTFYAGNEYVIFERSFTVTHQPDGSRTLTVRADYDDSYISPLSLDAVACELPPIARASEIAEVSLADGAIEAGVTVTFAAASPTFTHRLALRAAGAEVAVWEDYRSGTPVTLTAAELLTLYRTGERTLTVALTTRQGGMDVGTAETTLALTALGNLHLYRDGLWQRGLALVGRRPAVALVRHNGEWRAAK